MVRNGRAYDSRSFALPGSIHEGAEEVGFDFGIVVEEQTVVGPVLESPTHPCIVAARESQVSTGLQEGQIGVGGPDRLLAPVARSIVDHQNLEIPVVHRTKAPQTSQGVLAAIPVEDDDDDAS